jgi:hemerythrin-like domain-containing protein
MLTMARNERRSFLRKGAATSAALLVAGFARAAPPQNQDSRQISPAEEGTDVSALEGLMREHGLLARILLIYEESARLLEAGTEFPPQALGFAAITLKDFVEKYHEKIEEKHVFPRLERAKTLVDLTRLLRRQHAVGKILTNNIIIESGPDLMERREDHAKLARELRQYVRMMRPHTAREDTVVFPEFRKLVSKQEYHALAEVFEKQEHKVLKNVGFEERVQRVATLEDLLGLDDLARVTPN